jgi:hypothetical protein
MCCCFERGERAAHIPIAGSREMGACIVFEHKVGDTDSIWMHERSLKNDSDILLCHGLEAEDNGA